MDSYERFHDSIKKAAAKFKSWDKNQTIRLISHLDADGISASAVIINLLNQENRKYAISILQQLDKETILKLSKEKYKHIIFTDLGSGQLKDINEDLKDKEIIILDHHEPEKVKINENIMHINPHLFKIDGSKEISGSGVVYLFACSVNPKNQELAHLPIIGAIGDIQEEGGFLKLNKKILDTALKQEKIKTMQGLRLFGAQTKPLHKVLEYSTDPYIPGVSGSESGTIQFLHQIGVEPKKGNAWKKLVDLDKEEMKKLVAGIIMKRFEEDSPDDVLGNIYILPNEKKGSPTRDAREYATLLNACGRMGRASAGIGLCLGIEKDSRMAFQTLAEYKKEIVNALKWYEKNHDSKKIIKGKKYMILNAKDEIMSTIIGTLASIISKSNELDEDTYILSLARTGNGTAKVSLRFSGQRDKEIDLREIVKKIVSKVGGEAGGHMFAAGASIPIEKEDEFVKTAKEILETEAQNI
jgi:RecJ-like exonuclease